jgi:hypothetical protein
LRYGEQMSATRHVVLRASLSLFQEERKLMRLRSIIGMFALSMLTVLLVIGATARVSLGDDARVEATPMVLQSVVGDELPADECTLQDEAVEAAENQDLGAAYECPRGIPYCQKASQCTEYCGVGFESCFQGCCACTG